MKDADLIRLLFEAHRDENEELFQQTAQSIIGKELASNHHDAAQRLIRALGLTRQKSAERSKLTRLPVRTSASTDALVLRRADEKIQRPVLSSQVCRQIDRLIAEHRNRERLLSHGLRPATRVLFWGPPGNGKTLTAHFVAQQLYLPIATANLSGIISSLLGATATQLERIFKAASEQSLILFLDEFDALGKERDDELEIGEPKRIVNSLLQNIDAFSSSRSLLIAATNHQYLLDSAVWRRFDFVIKFPQPGARERETQLKQLLSGVKLSGTLSRIVTSSDKMSYADLALAVQEALKTMVLESRKSVSDAEIIRCIQERKRAVLSARAARTPNR